MIKDVMAAIAAAARKLFSNWGALVISFLLFAVLWSAGYLFATTRLATTLLVWLNALLLPLVALITFFTWQAMGLSYVRIGVGAGYLFKRALQDCWKLLLASVPVLLLAWLVVYLLAKADAKWVADVEKPQRWIVLTLTWGKAVLLYLVLPLMAIHCWLAAIREGLKGALKGLFRHLARAFAPRAILIYVLVWVIFGALAYLAFFTKTPIKSDWAELWVVGARFAVGWLLLFGGWMVTLGALAESSARRALGDLEV
ncbi:MAG: hypothetical protein JNJ50_02460 [Acidobacteria bacterium]|nr:hypothetical protein [Acidobacteriota bacterium]